MLGNTSEDGCLAGPAVALCGTGGDVGDAFPDDVEQGALRRHRQYGACSGQFDVEGLAADRQCLLNTWRAELF